MFLFFQIFFSFSLAVLLFCKTELAAAEEIAKPALNKRHVSMPLEDGVRNGCQAVNINAVLVPCSVWFRIPGSLLPQTAAVPGRPSLDSSAWASVTFQTDD